jgi:sarcosine oxidase, subunit beta
MQSSGGDGCSPFSRRPDDGRPLVPYSLSSHDEALGVRSPDQRVVVVGAGVLGLSTAWHLVRAGNRAVTVLESSNVASGSSSRSVGMVETQYLDPFEIAMRAYGRRVFDDLERDHELPFARQGYLRLAHDAAELGSFEASSALQKELGCDGRVVTSAEVAQLVPDLARGACVGGLWGPNDGYVDGHRYCNVLAQLVRDGGGVIHTRCPVLGLESGPAVRTPAGTFEADVVVNAAGPWAGQVGERLGAPVPLAPQLHEVVNVQLVRRLDYVMPFVMDYVPGSGGDGVYFRQDAPLGLLAGLHSDEAVYEAVEPDVPLFAPGPDFLERIALRLAELLPDLDAGIGSGWSGLYPTTPDGHPVVGVHPDAPHVVCALGAGGVGIQLSPAIGRAAAESCLTGTSTSLPPTSTWSAARLSSVPKQLT